jgi:hypothetical protein
MKSIQKPVGIYVFAIFVIIGYGLFPLVGVFPISSREVFLVTVGALPFNGSIYFLHDQNGEGPFALIFSAIFLCVFTVASALWASVGHNEGRISLLIFATLNFLFWMTFVFIAIVYAPDGQAIIQLVTSMITPPIWIGAVWWYFTKGEVVAYYKQESKISNESKFIF